MTTIRDLAAEYGIQPYEVAASLDLGTSYDETAELAAITESEYRMVLDILDNDASTAHDVTVVTSILADDEVEQVIQREAFTHRMWTALKGSTLSVEDTGSAADQAYRVDLEVDGTVVDSYGTIAR